jgi:hypothetical protein
MSRMHRYAGAALALGSLLWLVCLVWGDTAFEGFRPSHAADSAWGAVVVLQLLGALLAMTGFVGVYARQSGSTGMAGLWGYGLTMAAGMLLGTQPQRVAGGDLAWVATIVFAAGALLFGWATQKAGVWPAWSGWGLIVAGVLAVLVMVARAVGMVLPPLGADLPFVVWMLLAVYWGWQLLGISGPAPARAAASGARA